MPDEKTPRRSSSSRPRPRRTEAQDEAAAPLEDDPATTPAPEPPADEPTAAAEPEAAEKPEEAEAHEPQPTAADRARAAAAAAAAEPEPEATPEPEEPSLSVAEFIATPAYINPDDPPRSADLVGAFHDKGLPDDALLTPSQAAALLEEHRNRPVATDEPPQDDLTDAPTEDEE